MIPEIKIECQCQVQVNEIVIGTSVRMSIRTIDAWLKIFKLKLNE